jgi:hypothetical protein
MAFVFDSSTNEGEGWLIALCACEGNESRKANRTKLAHEPCMWRRHVLSDRPHFFLFLACPRRPSGGLESDGDLSNCFGAAQPDRPLLPILFGRSAGELPGLSLRRYLSSALLLFFPCCDSEFPIESFSTLLFYTMSDTKIRAPPSHYPFLAFHLVRTCSLVCSTIVSGILLYFCYWLKHDNYKIPWTFLVVCQSVSACVRMTLITSLSFSQYHSLP